MHQDGISGKESFAKTSFLRYIGYLNFIKDLTKHGLLQIQALVPPPELSKLLTSCLTAIKKHVIKYCDKVFERSGRNLFWSINNSNEVLNKLKSRQFRAFILSTYDFSTLYTTLPHNLIKEKLNDLIEWTFHREDSLYLACNVRIAFFTSEMHKNYTLWTCQKVCDALTFVLDNIYIRFGTKLFRQIVYIPMGTNCAPLVADLFLFCYERDFMISLSVENHLKSLKLLARLQDIWMIYWILTIPTSTV